MNGEVIKISNSKSTVEYRNSGYNIKEKIEYDSFTNPNTYSYIRLLKNMICYIEFVVEEVNKDN